MMRGRPVAGVRACWRALAVGAVVLLAAGSAWQGTESLAVADQGTRAAASTVVEKAPPATDSGTATGRTRPGLTKAGLVSVTSLDAAHLWLGLKDPRDRGAAFDVRVDLLNNGTTVASGVRRCVRDLAGGAFRTATEVVVPWEEFTPPKLRVGDVLALRVSTRIGTREDGTRCGDRARSAGVRLFYGSAERASRFAATITPDPSVDLYLRSKLSEEAPKAGVAKRRNSAVLRFGNGNPWAKVGGWKLDPQCDCANELIPDVRTNPPAPKPERIDVKRLPLPPAPPSAEPSSCVAPTGCITSSGGPGWTPDGRHVIMYVAYAGAPEGSVYTGTQMLIVKTDGRRFSNGEPWKCLTCGVPAENRKGAGGAYLYVQPFRDGKRVLGGTNIVDCGQHRVVDDACTPDQVHIHPIRWNATPDGSGEGGAMRELRLHPDNVHLGWSSVAVAPGNRFDQFSYLGRLVFNPAPATGEPRVPRYELTNVTRLFDAAPEAQPLRIKPGNPGELEYDPQARSVGELRGFSSDGREVIYVGYPDESANIDVFAADLTTGKVRRLTRHPEYTDPVDSSPDDNWIVAEDTRGTDRQMFVAGMRAIPPVTDLVTTSAVSSIRNNHQRRFFQPYLIDRYGDRGSYNGQPLNACTARDKPGRPGSICDPNWNASADPAWSPDGTSVVYGQRLVTAPACGGANPLPCPESTEPGGRTSRLMIAELVERKPQPAEPVAPISDVVSWGTPYVPGDPAPVRPYPPEGTYTLRGQMFGAAQVEISWSDGGTTVETVAVDYTNYSDDGIHVLNGTERVTRENPTLTSSTLHWYSDLVQTGCTNGTKTTSPDGFHLTIDLFETVFDATGTMTTTIDGRTYRQPENGT